MRNESKPAKSSRRRVAGLVAAAILAATALGVTSSRAADKKPPFVIGVSNDSVANPFRVQMINEIKYYASKHPELIKDLIVLNAGEDTNKQISDVQDLIARGVDGIVLSPHSNTAFVSVLKDAKENGIPVATYNNNITEGANLLVAQVTPPFKEWQRQTTEWLAKAMGGKGNVIVLRGIAGTPVDGYEWDGAKEILDQNPGIKVICTEYANWDYGAAKTAVQNCLANHPEVNGVLSFGDAMTWAAGEVLAGQGYDIAKIPMIGIGGGNGAFKWWAANPKVQAYMIGDHTDVAVYATLDVINALTGKTGEKVEIPTKVVTSETLKNFVQPDLPDNVWLLGTQLPVDQLKKQATR
ncbi:MAG TPA: substrate-binding domain-containing protein [Roseiarcus sp.]|nr:substrate-binding domain-containing protein [Roseiarcus sp.]